MSNKAELGAKAKEIAKDLDFESSKFEVKFETSKGDISLELYPDVAPNHCKNIVSLAQAGFYDDLNFHRIVKGFVIQGGCPLGNGTGGPGYQIDGEFNDKKHVKGTLSMARAQDPNSAGSQFFICLEDTPFLDGDYTVFGQATAESLSVVDAIGAVETGAGDKPMEEIKINKVTVSQSAL